MQWWRGEREIEERWWKGWFLSEPEGAGSGSAGIGRASCSFSLTELDHLSLLLTESIKIQLPITDCGLWDHAAWLRYIFENQKQAERRREAIIVRKNFQKKKVEREREVGRTEEHFVSTACWKNPVQVWGGHSGFGKMVDGLLLVRGQLN